MDKFNVSKEWLIDQRLKFHLTYKQIAKMLSASKETIRRLYKNLEIITPRNFHHHLKYSNTQLLSFLEQAHDKIGFINQSRYDAWAKQHDAPRASTIQDRFQCFEKALEITGLKSETEDTATSDDIIKHNLTILIEEVGYPTEKQIKANCPFTKSLLNHRFGGIEGALKHFGLQASKTIKCIDCDKEITVHPDGHARKRCHRCWLAYKLTNLKQWTSNNSEKAKLNHRQWYWKNRELNLIKHKQWYLKLKQRLGVSDAKIKIGQNIIAGYLKELYPTCTIMQEKTWPWLLNPKTGRHMFVDIFIPELQLVVEFHGRYHYEVIPPFTKNLEELEYRQSRDKIKKELCNSHGLRHVTIPYTVGISKSALYNILHVVYIKENSHIKEFGVPYNRKKGDVGYDLHASHDITITPNQHVNIGTEVYLDMPYDIYASILLRSSMAKKGLMTHQSLIDSGYRGELKLMVWNFSDKPISIEKGERVAQILFAPKAFISIIPIAELNISARGATGYGSTGV